MFHREKKFHKKKSKILQDTCPYQNITFIKYCCSSFLEFWVFLNSTHLYMWDDDLVLHRKVSQWGNNSALWRNQFYRAVTQQIKSPGLACTPVAPADLPREGAGDQQSAPFRYGGIRKTKKNGRNPYMSSLTMIFNVQLIGLKRGTAFCCLRCTRKPLLATLPLHSEGQSLLQSTVLYLHKAHQICVRFTRTEEKQLCKQLEFSHASLQDLWHSSWHILTNYFFLFYLLSLAFFDVSLQNKTGH